jgi:hypothetical protein
MDVFLLPFKIILGVKILEIKGLIRWEAVVVILCDVTARSEDLAKVDNIVVVLDDKNQG